MLKSLVLRVFAVSFFVLGCNAAVAQDKANYAYLGLEPEIVTNYISDSAQKLGYVRVSVELMIHDVNQLEIAEHHMPLLRSTAIPVSNSQFFNCALGIVMPEGACQSTAKPTGKVALKLTRKARIMNLLV